MAKLKEFSKWMYLTKMSLDDIPKKAGIYEIRMPRSINRLIGKDKEGILEIGQSNNLQVRLKRFYTAATGGKASHSEGLRFHHLRLASKLDVKTDHLKMCFREIDKIKLKSAEKGYLSRYQKKYGELPPLNSSGGI